MRINVFPKGEFDVLVRHRAAFEAKDSGWNIKSVIRMAAI
jgi:hypothetical protein